MNLVGFVHLEEEDFEGEAEAMELERGEACDAAVAKL